MPGRLAFGLGVSSITLAVVMMLWPQFFLFSKVVYLPAWASALPAPFSLPALLAAVCLAPAAFVPCPLKQAVGATFGASAAASTILVFASLSRWPKGYVLANAAFNYAWALFPCLAAAIILLALRLVARKISGEAHG